MDNYTTFFILAGIWAISWNICKFIFWLDSPRKEVKR